MKSRTFSKLLTMLMVVASTVVLMTASFDAEARRFGGGMSLGRQSTNVMKQRQATKAPAAAASRGAAAGQGARAGGSRWLGPLAGIAAGLGLAALLSHLGLSGAMADLLVIALIAGLAIFALRFFAARSMAARTAGQGAGGSGHMGNMSQRQMFDAGGQAQSRQNSLFGAGASNATSDPVVGSFFIPAQFDQQTFLDEAKRQFVAIQKAWDDSDYDGLRSLLTNDLYGEFAGQLQARTEHKPTDVVMLNAELLGIEKLEDGYLASVRYSGMIREDAAPEATSFEEVWNLEKIGDQGWLLAGIQQV